jgi:hypothetical protein
VTLAHRLLNRLLDFILALTKNSITLFLIEIKITKIEYLVLADAVVVRKVLGGHEQLEVAAFNTLFEQTLGYEVRHVVLAFFIFTFVFISSRIIEIRTMRFVFLFTNTGRAVKGENQRFAWLAQVKVTLEGVNERVLDKRLSVQVLV